MIGIDLIALPRMKRFIQRFGDKGLARFLDEGERALVKNHRTAAGFWAAKEACSKALGCGIGRECGFHDMRIAKTPQGAPYLTLSNTLQTAFSITEIAISITHDGDYAIAVVTLQKGKTL
jgi:holo-[acyl-carrier protein] synthase